MPGGSWITSVLGYIVIALDLINQAFVKQGIPQTFGEWITLAGGIVVGLIGIFSKDFNKSNASAPVSTANTVPPSV